MLDTSLRGSASSSRTSKESALETDLAGHRARQRSLRNGRAVLKGNTPMEHDYILWVAAAAYGLHMTEEAVYDWRSWARNVLKIPAEWNEFYLFNAVVALLGISCAMIGWRAPALSLLFPAFMLINAILFHIVPTVKTRIFSPGLFTAIILFLPIGSYCYVFAADDGVLTGSAVMISATLGFLIMMMPIVIQKTKNRPMFRKFADRG
jgi:hypothetical protein